MPRQTSEFRVVVASPLDISEERKAVFDSLTELNRTLDIQGTSLKVIGWEDYSSPGVGHDAQQVVNRQILDEYDILIGLFGTRLGTPTSQARSGTVEEIEKALRAKMRQWENSMCKFILATESSRFLKSMCPILSR